MTHICIIPARGGSKRIPRKNILNFRGKPMIAWSIESAQKANCFDRIIVSTDDHDIKQIALSCNAEVPFLRPSELADDYASTKEVIIHTIEWLEKHLYVAKSVCCLYATAPFITSDDLIQASNMLSTSTINEIIFTATSFAYPIQRAIRIDKSNHSSMFYPEFINSRSQDLEEAFHDAGLFYWGYKEIWKTMTNLFEGGRPLLIPRWRVQDIDTLEDWKRAELMHEVLERQRREY